MSISVDLKYTWLDRKKRYIDSIKQKIANYSYFILKLMNMLYSLSEYMFCNYWIYK
jgi:hypothetical protein